MCKQTHLVYVILENASEVFRPYVWYTQYRTCSYLSTLLISYKWLTCNPCDSAGYLYQSVYVLQGNQVRLSVSLYINTANVIISPLFVGNSEWPYIAADLWIFRKRIDYPLISTTHLPKSPVTFMAFLCPQIILHFLLLYPIFMNENGVFFSW